MICKIQKLGLFIFTLVFCIPAARAEIRYEEVLGLGKQFEPRALEYVQQNHAEIRPTKDGRSFVVWWAPENFDPKRDTVFVSLHGHQGWATKGFQVWHPHLKDRTYAFLAIQWWYGRSAEPIGYAKPKDIYPWIREALEARAVPPGHIIFEAFSMGGANSYAVTYLDRMQKTPYFVVTISNSGAMEENFPPNRVFLEQGAGSKPFSGVHWILYCSEHDEQRPQSCEKMEWTNTKLQELGATVDMFVRDPVGQHGGFMAPNIFGPALDLADQILAKK